MGSLKRRAPALTGGGFAFFALLISATCLANPPRRVGIGIVLGDPTGGTVKVRLSPDHAVQLHAGLGIGRFDGDRGVFALDYLFHVAGLFPGVDDTGLLAPYVGIGAKLGVRESSTHPINLGVRVPLGLAFLLKRAPIEVFLELALGVHVLRDVAPLVDGGVGGRWYF